MSFIFRRLFGSSPSITMEAAQKKAQQLIDDNAVMVFSKSYCPYCNNTKRVLDGLNAKYKAIELNQEDDGDDIQNALQKMTGQRTVPNVFIGRVHIGGNSDLEAVVKNGKDGKGIQELLQEAGAL
ncbi:thioredoxin-like protein [Parachaetomium inaequale]|uniref:Thioredoxin-like protein n=1 Tax=Parachaetomium inaequale TaxID=2588326 RepID=A0AAN6ST35_9PEZI|nr:thioredoxin-like protein [Parachaetomium inaequale]